MSFLPIWENQRKDDEIWPYFSLVFFLVRLASALILYAHKNPGVLGKALEALLEDSGITIHRTLNAGGFINSKLKLIIYLHGPMTGMAIEMGQS